MNAPHFPTLGELVSAALQIDIALPSTPELDQRAQVCSAIELSRQIAPLLDCTPQEAFQSLTYVPENMLDLLTSPQGWSALAAYVATDFNGGPLDYAPAIH